MSKIKRISNFVDGTIEYRNPKLGQCYNVQQDFVPEGNPTPAQLSAEVDMPANSEYQSPKPPKDNDKWSAIKKSGVIKFTPLFRYRSKTSYLPVRVKQYAFALGWPYCGTTPRVYGEQQKAISIWERNLVPADLSTITDLTNRKEDEAMPDIEAELNSLRSDVVASNLLTYDLLTELAEAQDTAKLILGLIKAVRHPIQSFLDFRRTLMKNDKLSPTQIKKALEQKWMEYRYAIMPLAYSVKDIVKLAKEKGDIYKTDRKSKTLTLTLGQRPQTVQNSLYKWTSTDIQYRLSVVGKASFDPDELYLRLFDQIGFNPFVTAWELIPYSFVIDWFANVGDWVLAQTAGLGPGAQQRAFCQSIKETRVTSTFVVDQRVWKAERTYPDGVVSVGPIESNSESLMVRVEEESYTRTLFTPADVKLQFDAYLNWKRYIDAWVLSQRPLITALRKLK